MDAKEIRWLWYPLYHYIVTIWVLSVHPKIRSNTQLTDIFSNTLPPKLFCEIRRNWALAIHPKSMLNELWFICFYLLNHALRYNILDACAVNCIRMYYATYHNKFYPQCRLGSPPLSKPPLKIRHSDGKAEPHSKSSLVAVITTATNSWQSKTAIDKHKKAK